MGMKGKLYWPQVITFQASASSLGLPSGSKASGWPIFSAAAEKPSGTPSCVSPLMPSASISFISSAMASGQGWPGSRVPWSHIIMGNSTRTPRRWKSATIWRTPSTPPGMDSNHVELVAIVDAHVGIGGPDQHRVDAAIALLEIVEIAIDGVLAGDGIVEVAILHHHLRLDEAGLRPLERGQIIARTVIADADAPLGAPVLKVLQPVGMRSRSAAGAGHGLPDVVQVHAVGRWNLLAARGVVGVLGAGGEGERQKQGWGEEKRRAAGLGKFTHGHGHFLEGRAMDRL